MMKFKVYYAKDVDGQKEKIIKLSDVNDLIDENITTYKDVYVKGVTDLLEEEMNKGGLDPYALCIEGQTPAYDKATKINKKAHSLNDDLATLDKKIESCLHKQRSKELEDLSVAISEAIDEHQAKLNDYNKKSTALKDQWDNVRSAQINCNNRGISYTTTKGMNYGYREYTNLLGETTATITEPYAAENSFDDDIETERQEIENLGKKKEEVDTEASQEKGKVA